MSKWNRESDTEWERKSVREWDYEIEWERGRACEREKF